jgi:arylsulfatase A-like enzyme
MLRDHGYQTRMIGKWHLGFERALHAQKTALNFSNPLKGGPIDRGFDSFFGIRASAGSSPLCMIRDKQVEVLPTEMDTIKKYKTDGRATEVKVMRAPDYQPEDVSPTLCSEALKVIRDHAESKSEHPLFLYYASPIPHQPWVPQARFKGESGLGDYADFVMQLDDVVGQINSALKETGLDQNTLFIFTSDNGTGPSAFKLMEKAGHASSGPLRGAKADSWEGGHRVPFIVKWPEQIAPNQQTSALINFTDLFATFADLLDVDTANEYAMSATDSHSFLPVLWSPSDGYQRPGYMYDRWGVREGPWKLVAKSRVRQLDKVKRTQFELFNLESDLSERNNVSEQNPERFERLFNAYHAYIRSRELK